MQTVLSTLYLLSALSASVCADGIYTKNSPVLQVSNKDFGSLIEQSNHTSIVEFYAPWCGHCQTLKPAYEKAAKSLAGLAKVAAVNCDEESNKPLCGRMGVQGFPTLKIVRPGSKKGRPAIEDYQGERSAKAIVDAVVNKIPNHVRKVQGSDIEAWLTQGTSAKTILFTEKGTTAPLIKALAVDFLGSIDFATVRSKEKMLVQRYGVTKFPTIVLISTSGSEPKTYDGDMKRESLIKFFAQVASPNLDPAPGKPKAATAKKSRSTSSRASASASASAKFSRASKAYKSSEFDEYMEAQTIELTDDTPTASPLPIVDHDQKPMVIKEAASALPKLGTASELEASCLGQKSGNCILILMPDQDSSDTVPPLAAEALASFAEVAEKHRKRKTNIFPFYEVAATNEAGDRIRRELNLKSKSELEIIAINMKRKWWRSFSPAGYDIADAENFVDAIRLGEGAKKRLPGGFYTDSTTVASEPAAPASEAEPQVEVHSDETTGSAIPSQEPASTAEVPPHNEL